MRLLVEIAVLCCVALLLVSLALWRSTRRAQSPEASDFAEVMRRARSGPHPRLDLAAGRAPMQQQVNSARRRRTDVPVATERRVSAARAAAYSPRQDRAYFKEDLGDLSDPDLRKPTAESIRRRPLS